MDVPRSRWVKMGQDRWVKMGEGGGNLVSTVAAIYSYERWEEEEMANGWQWRIGINEENEEGREGRRTHAIHAIPGSIQTEYNVSMRECGLGGRRERGSVVLYPPAYNVRSNTVCNCRL